MAAIVYLGDYSVLIEKEGVKVTINKVEKIRSGKKRGKKGYMATLYVLGEKASVCSEVFRLKTEAEKQGQLMFEEKTRRKGND